MIKEETPSIKKKKKLRNQLEENFEDMDFKIRPLVREESKQVKAEEEKIEAEEKSNIESKLPIIRSYIQLSDTELKPLKLRTTFLKLAQLGDVQKVILYVLCRRFKGRSLKSILNVLGKALGLDPWRDPQGNLIFGRNRLYIIKKRNTSHY